MAFVVVAVLASALAATPLPPGRYRLDVSISSSTAVPLIGDSVTRSMSVVDIDASGDARQQTCAITTTGRGYVVRATPRALAALPVQRYRWVVDGDRVYADPGPLRFGDDDGDRDGAVGLAMDLTIDAFGSFVVQVQSSGHTVLAGTRTDAGAGGRAIVKQSRQRVLSGLPMRVDGESRVDDARFVLTRLSASVSGGGGDGGDRSKDGGAPDVGCP